MRVLICGVDGYIGWPLAMHLAARGHRVAGIDNLTRRIRVQDDGGESAIPIESMDMRARAFGNTFPESHLECHIADIAHHGELKATLRSFEPKAVVHLGEIPSAPFSMANYARLKATFGNNVMGTLSLLEAMKKECSSAHLIKLGSMGVAGTPNVPIQEGWFDCTIDGRTDRMLFPHRPASWYHCTKSNDSTNVEFACRLWGLAATDIHQGVVYGTRTAEMVAPELRTRFDYCGVWGTALNRFVAQAIAGVPITPYGKGGQKRGFIPLTDSIQCLTIAIENPATPSDYRVFNQLEEVYQIDELAAVVALVAKQFELNPIIQHIENPRKEAENHYYAPAHQHLLDLGYKPTTDMRRQLVTMFEDLLPHRDRILEHVAAITPQIAWK